MKKQAWVNWSKIIRPRYGKNLSNDECKIIFSVLFKACPFFSHQPPLFIIPPFFDRSGIGSSEDKLETIKIPTASLLLWPGNFLATSLSLLAMTLSCRCIKKYLPKVYSLTFWATFKGTWFRHQRAVNWHI